MPFTSLPVELIVYITAELVALSTSSILKHIKSHDALLSPSMPCTRLRGKSGLPGLFVMCSLNRYIRTCVLESNMLWSKQALCAPPQLGAVIQRCGDLLLQLRASDPICNCFLIDVEPFLPRASRIEIFIASQRRDTCRSGYAKTSASLVTHALQRGLPSLEVLDIRMDCLPESDTYTRLEAPLPQLITAILQNIPILPISPKLRSLELVMDFDALRIGIHELLDCLGACPRLQKLVLRNAVAIDRPPWELASTLPHSPLHLPELQTFVCVGDYMTATYVLACLEAPLGVEIGFDVSISLQSLRTPGRSLMPILAIPLYSHLHPGHSRELLVDFEAQLLARMGGNPSPEISVPTSTDMGLTLPTLGLHVSRDDTTHDLTRSSGRDWPRAITFISAATPEQVLSQSAPDEAELPNLSTPARHYFTLRGEEPDADSTSDNTFNPRRAEAVSMVLNKHLLFINRRTTRAFVIAPGSWIPASSKEWAFLITRFPCLERVEVHSFMHRQDIWALARALARDRRLQKLRIILISQCRFRGDELSTLIMELHRFLSSRFVDGLPEVTWILSS